MKQVIFNVRFRMEQENPSILIAEYDNVGKKTITQLRFPIDAIRHISGSSNIIFMNDTAETIGDSIINANQGRGMIFDPENKFLYKQVRGVELDEGEMNFIRFLGLTEANDMVCIACEKFEKEVVKNA